VGYSRYARTAFLNHFQTAIRFCRCTFSSATNKNRDPEQELLIAISSVAQLKDLRLFLLALFLPQTL
jgi:hypothetical protein